MQGEARQGYAALGLPESGPLDPYAHAAANLLLGNAEDAAAVEIIGVGEGPDFVCVGGGLVAIGGADLGAEVEGRRVPAWHALWLRDGETLRFAGRTNIEGNGGVAYLAVAGGLALPRYLGSASAYLGAAGALPDLAGRYLSADDELPFGSRGVAGEAGHTWPLDEGRSYPGKRQIPITWGPHADRLGRRGKAALLGQRWTVAESNRLGMRLAGEPLPISGAELVSAGVVRGTVQLPPSGLPIILGPDHQTTGGYPIVAIIPSAGWHLLGQLLSGDQFSFELITLATARERAEQLRARLRLAAQTLAKEQTATYSHI